MLSWCSAAISAVMHLGHPARPGGLPRGAHDEIRGRDRTDEISTRLLGPFLGDLPASFGAIDEKCSGVRGAKFEVRPRRARVFGLAIDR